MAKRVRTPEEKKRLSYERDGRNTYGQNDKASRKAIPAFKASTNRTLRHAVKQSLPLSALDRSGERADAKIADETFKGRHPIKQKSPDEPLGRVIALKHQKRDQRVGARKVRQRIRAEVAK
jgi:hypothetical protein